MTKIEAKSTRNVARIILLFALPYMLNILVQNLYGAVDMFVVGHFGVPSDGSAVTVGSQVMSMCTQLIVGLTTAITVLVGRFHGAGKEREKSQVFGSASVVIMIVGVLLAAVLIIFNRQIVGVLNTPEEAVEKACQYNFICAIGVIFITAYNVIAGAMMGVGNTRAPFIFICIACVINVGADFLLVGGFGMGAMGAAIATTAAQVCCVLFALIYMKVKGIGFKVYKADFKPSLKFVVETGKIGLPTAVQNMLIGISFLLITAIINVMGVEASAAVGVVERIIVMLMIPATAMSNAVSAIASRYMGGGDNKTANKTLLLSILMACAFGVVATLLTYFVPQFFTRILTSNTEVSALAAQYLQTYGFDIIATALMFPINGYLICKGYSWFSLVHSVLSTFAVRVPVSIALSGEGASLWALGWAAPLSTLVSLALCGIFFIVVHLVGKRRQSNN